MNKIVYVIISALFMTGFSCSSMAEKFAKTYPVIIHNGKASVDLKIDRETAVFIALQQGLLDKPDYKSIQNSVGSRLKWVIGSYLDNQGWTILLKSDNIVPSFTCKMIIDKSGKATDQGCRWNK